MKRFNCKDGPVEMEESKAGYWVTYEDHNRTTVLGVNRTSDRAWEADIETHRKIKEEYEDKLSKQQTVIVYQSVVIFVFSAIFVFVIGLL